LDSSDHLYATLRDRNFAVVGSELNKIARRLNDDYEGRHQAKTVTQMKDFVNKLGGLQSEHHALRLHTNLTEEILNSTKADFFNKSLEVQQNLTAGADINSLNATIEELISRSAPFAQVLRLLCLESLTNGGLKPKDLDFFKREVLQTYGYEHILTLDALEKMNLLTSRSSSSKSAYSSLRKSLRLIVDEVNEQDPDDVAYVYSGYAPLSVRLVQCVLQKQAVLPQGSKVTGAGWKGMEDVVKLVHGKSFDEVQRGPEKTVRARNILNGQPQRQISVVFFLGGCTFTEISALRFIAQQEGRTIIIATTGIINGRKVIQAALSNVGV